MYPYRFNSTAVFEAFGGPTALHKYLNDKGLRVKKKTVQKWRERDSIPADVIVSICMYSGQMIPYTESTKTRMTK